MKKILLTLFIIPVIARAQNLPRFENDTLYMSGGYKIFIGQALQFGKANAKGGKFKYIDIKNGVNESSLEDNHIIVKELKGFGTARGNSYIGVGGNITFKDGSKGAVDLRLWFDQAAIQGELVVPKEFIQATNSQGLPRFERDTLYTSSGYKIYKGLTLQFGKPTGRREFQFVNIKSNVSPARLQNHFILVKELRDFGISVLNNGYITIIGTLMINNNERGDIEVHMAFDHAIENLPGVPSELIVPAEYRGKRKMDPSRDLERLNKLYQNGIITLEELERHKKMVGQ